MILFLLFHANNPVGYVSFQLKTTLKFKLVASGKPYRHLLGNPKRRGAGMGSKEFKVGLKIHQKVIKPCANTSQKNPKQLWKSPEYDYFDSHNAQKWTLNTAKIGKIVYLKSLFSGSFINLSSWKYNQTWAYLGGKQCLTISKQLLNNFEKVHKGNFWFPKWSKMTPQNSQNMQIFNRNLNFLGHLSTFRAGNAH